MPVAYDLPTRKPTRGRWIFVLTPVLLVLPGRGEAQVDAVLTQVRSGLEAISTDLANQRAYGGNYDPVTTVLLARVQGEVDADRIVIDRLLAQITSQTGADADTVTGGAMRRLAERAADADASAAAAQAQAENILAGALALALANKASKEALDAVNRRVAVLARVRDLELLRARNLRDVATAIAPVH